MNTNVTNGVCNRIGDGDGDILVDSNLSILPQLTQELDPQRYVCVITNTTCCRHVVFIQNPTKISTTTGQIFDFWCST